LASSLYFFRWRSWFVNDPLSHNRATRIPAIPVRKAAEKINHLLVRLKQSTLGELPIQTGTTAERPTAVSLLVKKRRRWTLLLWLAFFMNYVPLYFLVSWIPKIVMDSGLPLEHGIYAGVALNAGGLLGILIMGYFPDALGLRSFIRHFFLIAAICMIVFAFSPSQVGFLLTITFLLGLFISGGLVGLYMVSARIYPTEIRSAGVGWGIGPDVLVRLSVHISVAYGSVYSGRRH